MGAPKKSDNINQNYPLLGFRILKESRDSFLRDFEETLAILKAQPEYRRLNLKKNAVFLRALELGIEQIRKKRSLG